MNNVSSFLHPRQMMAGNEPHSSFIWVPGQAEEKQALTQGLGAENLLTSLPWARYQSLAVWCCTWNIKLTLEDFVEETLHFPPWPQESALRTSNASATREGVAICSCCRFVLCLLLNLFKNLSLLSFIWLAIKLSKLSSQKQSKMMEIKTRNGLYLQCKWSGSCSSRRKKWNYLLFKRWGRHCQEPPAAMGAGLSVAWGSGEGSQHTSM